MDDTSVSLEPTNTNMLLKRLQGLVTHLSWSPTQVIDLFQALLKRYESKETKDRSDLVLWMVKMLHCIEINYITPSWKSEKTLVELVQDCTVTDERLVETLNDKNEKTLDQIIEEIAEYVDRKILDEVREIVSSVSQGPKTFSDNSDKSQMKRALQKLVRAVKATMKITPKLTQMVSWCLMALSKKGRLIQVSTGEGKTCIVAMFAAYRASRGEKVDIMSSSPVLAERDFKEWQNFYKALKISVSCNINKSDTDLKQCYECQVVYGTAHDFAGDWLKHHFSRKDILGNRTFQCAIVDEVDSLMLDKGHHTVYLSCDMPALQHLNPLLARIWDTANKYIHSDKVGVLSTVETEITSILQYTPCDINNGEANCYVPGFLKELIESKLKVWIANALYAKMIEKDHEYVLESHGVIPVDYSCTGVLENSMQWSDGLHQFLQMKHQYKLSDMTAITNYMSNVGLLHMYGDQLYGVTGTLGQEVEIETLQKIYNITTCYIPTFRRRKLFEVEGVIVDDEEKWLEQICRVIKAQIRSERAVLVICETIGRAKAVNESLGNTVQNKILYISNNMDNTAVFKKALEAGDVIIATNLAGRGTDLSVSASVNTAGGLFVLQTFLPKNARVEAQAFGRTGRQGSPGSAQLIICSTHLPQQMQLLVLANGLLSLLRNMVNLTQVYKDLFEMKLKLYRNGHKDHNLCQTLSQILTRKSHTGIKLAKDVRDERVAHELQNYVDSDIPKMKIKQELFSQYLDFIKDFYQSNNQPAPSDLSALHEFWGVWLLINLNENDSSEALKTKLTSDLQRARDTLRNRLSPLSNLHHYTLFGNELREKGHFQASINMYTRAIEQDQSWAAIAYYNRAFARLVQQDNNQDLDCIEQSLEDLHQALKSIELYSHQNDIVYRFSKSHTEADQLLAFSISFDNHQAVRCKVWLLLKKNIEEAIEKLDRVHRIGGHLKVEESPIYVLARITDYYQSLSDFLILSVRLLWSRAPIWRHQLSNSFSSGIIHEFERLKSLGLTRVYALDPRFSLAGYFSKILRTTSSRFQGFSRFFSSLFEQNSEKLVFFYPFKFSLLIGFHLYYIIFILTYIIFMV